MAKYLELSRDCAALCADVQTRVVVVFRMSIRLAKLVSDVCLAPRRNGDFLIQLYANVGKYRHLT